MMKKSVANQDIKRLVFMTDNTWVLHFGKNYEELVLRSIRDKVPVIRIQNVNNSYSALPLDRAKYLLDKYYKLTGKPLEEQGSLENKKEKSVATDFFTEKAMLSLNFSSRQMAANGY